MPAKVEHGFSGDRGDRERDQSTRDAVQVTAEEQDEHDQQRIDAQVVAEHLRRHDMSLKLLPYDEQQRQPNRSQRLALQERHQDGRRSTLMYSRVKLGTRDRVGDPDTGDWLRARVTYARFRGMFCASVAYPVDAVDFDFDYFRDHHAPLFARLLGGNCARFEVHRALESPGAPPPPFRAAAYFWVESAEAFGDTLTEHGATLYADISNFSRTQPVRGWAEVS